MRNRIKGRLTNWDTLFRSNPRRAMMIFPPQRDFATLRSMVLPDDIVIAGYLDEGSEPVTVLIDSQETVDRLPATGPTIVFFKVPAEYRRDLFDISKPEEDVRPQEV